METSFSIIVGSTTVDNINILQIRVKRVQSK